MRILVTGGAGFIGSHYVRTLLAGGYPGFEQAAVTVLDKLTYAGNLANLDPVAGNSPAAFRPGRHLRRRAARGRWCRATTSCSTSLPRRTSTAQSTAPRISSPRTWSGVQVLLQACLDAGRGPGSAGVHRRGLRQHRGRRSWTEDAPLAPNSPYSAAKAGGDLMARAYARTHGLNVSITRCCNNYGPYQFPEKVIPLFVTNLLDGLTVPLYGDGGNVRGWIHVDDHCRGIQLVLERGPPRACTTSTATRS